jgi:hypothetical protein
MNAHRNPTTGLIRFVYIPGSGCFRAGGEDFTESQVADEICEEAWAARTRDGDVVAGPDKDQVARSGLNPAPGADLAARLDP